MSAATRPVSLTSAEECVDAVIAAVGRRIVLGTPLGLGKPNQVLNAFFDRARRDSTVELVIFTALSLEIPKPSGDIEARLLQPFIERHFGDYVELDYMKALRAGDLPANVSVHEFYFRAGSMKNVASAQRRYISTNYTFVARDLMDRGVNVLAQLVAEGDIDGEARFSLSCNTDVSLDLTAMLKANGRQFVSIAQVHRDLPFMYNRAIVEPEQFDYVVRNPRYDTTLFSTPNESVGTTDYAIGLHASTLIRDGGTLQIGIGSLGDAIVYACQLRHAENAAYRNAVAALGADETVAARIGGLGPFDVGLYGCSEMFVNGFLHLRRAEILKREVFDDAPLQRLLNEGEADPDDVPSVLRALLRDEVVGPVLSARDIAYLRRWGIFKSEVMLDGDVLRIGQETIPLDLALAGNLELVNELALGDRLRGGVYIHGAFFLGPPDFYAALRSMPRDEAEKIGMDSVMRINRIDDVELRGLQRLDARFINTAMMVTLFGAVVSDGLEDGQVISGVGGQYNFVAQAHELPGARSILCVRASRGSGRQVLSNIVFRYGHVTIPRHLRDIIVTEYGVADLRGRSDEEIVQALLAVADSRFQEELREAAAAAGKLDPAYRIPDRHRHNTPERIASAIDEGRRGGLFPAYPLGTELTSEEIALADSLRQIKSLMDNPKDLIRAVIRSFLHDVDEQQAAPYLERIGLQHPDTPKETILRHLLLLELEEQGVLRPL